MRNSAVDAVSGTYVVEDRGRHFFDMVSLGSPRGDAGLSERGRRRGRQIDRQKHTELPALASLDQLLSRTRCVSDMDTGQVKEAPLKLPAIRAGPCALLTADFKEWLRDPKARAAAVDDEEQRPTLSWHLLLLRATYNDGSLEAATVAEWLTEVLEVPLEAARRCAEAARQRPAVHLATFGDWPAAAEKVDSLRSLGLAVQVGSTGLHRALVSSRRTDATGAKAKASYVELFTGLPQVARKRRRVPAVPGSRSHDYRKAWRGISQKLSVDVMAQDPVKKLFKEERDPTTDPPWPADSESEAERSQWEAAKSQRRRVRRMLDKRQGLLKAALAVAEEPGLAVSKTPSSRPAPPSRSSSKSIVERTVQLTAHRREACQMMRFFVFGPATLLSDRKRDTIAADSMGTRSQVEMLCKMWMKLDGDHSGRCDFSEFRPFAEGRMTDLAKHILASPHFQLGLPAWASVQSEEDVPRIVAKFLKTLEQVLLGVKSSFVLEDMMRILWPAAPLSALAEMRRWGMDLAKALDRRIISTPPLLPEEQLEDLQCVFKYFDADTDGMLKASELLATGILNPSEVETLMHQHDVDGDGTLGIMEFCEMLCPHGFRAHDKATRANLADGTSAVYDPTMQSWQIELS